MMTLNVRIARLHYVHAPSIYIMSSSLYSPFNLPLHPDQLDDDLDQTAHDDVIRPAPRPYYAHAEHTHPYEPDSGDRTARLDVRLGRLV